MRRRRLGVVLVGVVTTLGLPLAQETPPTSEPLPTPLREQTEARLVQVDVSAIGPAELTRSLEADDFDVRVNTNRVRAFTLDRFCDVEAAPRPTDERRRARRDAPTTREVALPVTYLFYFDQPHLTLTGRQRAIDVAQDLLPELLVGGSRAMIVSNAAQQTLVEPLTGDVDALHEALERLERDRSQWDMFATDEDRRVADLVEVLNDSVDVTRAVSRARSYQREERWRTDKHLRRLTLGLSRLGDATSPKAVVYFADTLRRNPGEHYLTFFGSHVVEGNNQLMAAQSDSFTAGLPFDALLNEASAQGIRFYTIEAAGLSAPVDALQPAARVMEQTFTIPASSRVRFRDAKATLGGLARETGGRAFLDGIRPERIVDEMLGDLSCMYLISFDPGRLNEDRPVRLAVRSRRDGVSFRTRGRVVVKSESARTTTRLLSALAAGDRTEGGLRVTSELVPTDFSDGRYRALLQIRVPPTSLVATTWDLGASLQHDEHVYEEVSGRFATIEPGTMLVLEQEIELSPGDQRIYAMAHEVTGGLVLSDHRELTWPDPKGGPVITPITVVQPTGALFHREGASRRDGSVARAELEPVAADRPTALLGLVCRGKRKRMVVEARRRLVGASGVDFPSLELDLREERCAQLRDFVPAGLLAPGSYRYEVELIHDGDTAVRTERTFDAVSQEAS